MQETRHIYTGTVVRGDGIASRDYDMPTANLEFHDEIDLDTGVYAAVITYNNTPFEGVVCYGVGLPRKFEAHLFDFTGELLGETLSVELIEKVSELIPWQSKDRMRQKIFHDIELVRASLRKHL